ncbi:VanZ family protein [Methylomonas sp. HW2-6]|uniref:VanZ family protein n=1 Tax=Methylomonas sp. HW2-6 TaxID=3376687 RepID=UPI0040436191
MNTINSPFSKKTQVTLILLCVAWVLALFIESSQPPAQIIANTPGLDKVAHFVAFAALAFFIGVFWLSRQGKSRISVFAPPFWIALLVGVLEEGYQMTVPSRAASAWDLLADACGALAAMCVLNLLATVIWSRQ